MELVHGTGVTVAQQQARMHFEAVPRFRLWCGGFCGRCCRTFAALLLSCDFIVLAAFALLYQAGGGAALGGAGGVGIVQGSVEGASCT